MERARVGQRFAPTTPLPPPHSGRPTSLKGIKGLPSGGKGGARGAASVRVTIFNDRAVAPPRGGATGRLSFVGQAGGGGGGGRGGGGGLLRGVRRG